MAKTDTQKSLFNIKIIGIGISGCEAADYMSNSNLPNIDFVGNGISVPVPNDNLVKIDFFYTDTDSNTFKEINNGSFIHLKTRQGRLNFENQTEIQKTLRDSDLLVLVANIDDDTDNSILPLIARSAYETEPCLSVAVISLPTSYKSIEQKVATESTIKKLTKYVDSIISISNEPESVETARENNTHQHMLYAVQTFIDPLIRQGLIAVDLADMKAILATNGVYNFSSGQASGKHRATKAAESAAKKLYLKNAGSVLITILGSPVTTTLEEFSEVINTVEYLIPEGALWMVVTAFDDGMRSELRVTLIANENLERARLTRA